MSRRTFIDDLAAAELLDVLTPDDTVEILAAARPRALQPEDTVAVLAAAGGMRVCRGCGCTDGAACPGGCSWVEDDLCSRCA